MLRIARHAARLAVVALALAPSLAHAGYEVAPFAGYTKLAQGDAACLGEVAGPMAGVDLGVSTISLDIGGRLYDFGGKGPCGGSTELHALSLYFDAALEKPGPHGVLGFGLELGGVSGDVKAPGHAYDFSSGNLWATELWYKYPLSQDGLVRRGGQSYPAIITMLVARAGYRGGSLGYTDTGNFSDHSLSISGGYVTVGIDVYLNPSR